MYNHLRNNIRKILLENIDYVEKRVKASDVLRKTSEDWVKDINNKGQNINISIANDSSDFAKTSYMLEMLMYAYAKGDKNEFTLPYSGDIIIVNTKNIEMGISIFLHPSHDIQKFSYFISGGNFNITPNEIERMDSSGLLDKITTILFEKIPKTIHSYLSNEYYKNPSKSFINFIQTALRFPIRDLRRQVSKQKGVYMDDDSFLEKDILDISDTESPLDISQDINLKILYNINYKIWNIIKDFDSKNKNIKVSFITYFYYKVIGIGGDEKSMGQTLTNKQIVKKCLDGTAPIELVEEILNRTYRYTLRLFEKSPDIEYKFKKYYPHLFDEGGNLKMEKDLLHYMLSKKFQSIGTLKQLQILRKDMIDYFKKTTKYSQKIDFIKDYELINPKTKQPFTPIEYIKYITSATKSSTEMDSSGILVEDMSDENETSLTPSILMDIVKVTNANKRIQKIN